MSHKYGESYDYGSAGRKSYDEETDTFKENKPFAERYQDYESSPLDKPVTTESALRNDNTVSSETTNDQRYTQILELLGRLDERLRRSEDDREETERDVDELKRSLDSLEDKYLQSDKSVFELESRLARIDDIEHRVRNLNATDHHEFAEQISDIKNLIRDLEDKTENSERAYIKVEQKISTLERTEEDWRESEEEIKKRQKALEKSIAERQDTVESNIRKQQAEFEDIIQTRQIESEQRINQRQVEISETQTEQDKKLESLETVNADLVSRVETTQTEQFRMIEKLDDVLAQQARLGRRLDKVDQDRQRLYRKIEYLTELVDRNNQALQAKAMVLLTDQGVAERSNRPHVRPALSANEIAKREYLDDDHDADSEDEETPHNLRVEERRVLTGRHEEDESDTPREAQDTGREAIVTSFDEKLTDFGEADQKKEQKSSPQSEDQEHNTDSDHKAGQAETTQPESAETDRQPRLDPTDLEISDEQSPVWQRVLDNKIAVASAILVFGLIAGWGVSALVQSSDKSEIARLEEAIALSPGQDATPGGTSGDMATGGQEFEQIQGLNNERAYLPGKKFDFSQERGTDIVTPDTKPQSGAADPANPDVKEIAPSASPDRAEIQMAENTLRPDERSLQPQTKETESAGEVATDSQSPAPDEEELARLSEELNRIEPSGPITDIEPPEPKTEDRPTGSDRPTTGAGLEKPFYDPVKDPELAKVLDKQADQINSFLKSQPQGNLQDRIRPDSTLSPIVQKIEEKAFQGIPEAQHDLAAIYTAGHAGTEQNFERAAFWFREAAVEGISNARYNLGVLHHQGLGVKADLKEAIKWYRAASMLGHPEAQYNLGIAHIEGIGTNYRPKLATYYFVKAANQGVPEAAYNLGLIYENGLVGSEYPEIALFWYQEATNKGSKEAAAAHKQLQSKLKLNEKDAQKIYERLKGQIGPEGAGQSSSTSDARAKAQLASFSKAPGSSTEDGAEGLVTTIQKKLMDKGFYPGPTDGAYGPKTEDAIRAYQKSEGLTVTGLPSRDLLDHLRSN